MEGHYTNVTQIMIKKEEKIACSAAGDLKQPHHTSISIALNTSLMDDVVLLKVRNRNLWTISIRLCKPGSKSRSLHLKIYYLPHPFLSFSNCPPLTNQLIVVIPPYKLQLPNGWSMSYYRLYARGNQASWTLYHLFGNQWKFAAKQTNLHHKSTMQGADFSEGLKS